MAVTLVARSAVADPSTDIDRSRPAEWTDAARVTLLVLTITHRTTSTLRVVATMSLWNNTVGACFPAAPQGDPTLPVTAYEGDRRVASGHRDKRPFTFRRLIKSYWSDWALIGLLW